MCTLAPDFLFRPSQLLLMMHLLLHFLSQHHTNLFCISAYLCSGNLFLEMFHFHWNPPLRLFPIIQFNSVLSLWPWLLTLLANQWSDGYVTQFWQRNSNDYINISHKHCGTYHWHGKNHWVWVVFWDLGEEGIVLVCWLMELDVLDTLEL